MGLERMAAILQGVPSNYDTDLFQPLIKAIEKNSKGVSPYSGSYAPDAVLDAAYRRLADHARMISVCLADGVFPATSLNLKQIMRKSFKISTDVFQNPKLPRILYDEVVETLGTTYPELVTKEIDAKLIIDHEEQGYAKMRSGLKKKMRDLVKQYPEVETLSDVELPGFVQGYKELKETMAKQKSTEIPGELVFKLYDTHGLQEDLIKRIADLNKLSIDNKGFWSLLAKHKARHKTAMKEQDNRGQLFDEALKNLRSNGYVNTNDQLKYDYIQKEKKIEFKTLKTKIIGILNEDLDWIDFLDPCSDRPYYIVTKDTNFYCEEGGQEADRGAIYFNQNMVMEVDSVFKLQDFVFHKGHFLLTNEKKTNCVHCDMDVELEIDEERRLKLMQNHTGVHLLNAAVRRVLSKSAICPTGSSVTENGLLLNLESIKCNAPIDTRIVDSVQLSREPGVVTIPGETYPEVGLRLVTAFPPLVSKELCCGTHLPTTGALGEFCVTSVKGAGGQTPCIHALTGDKAKQARELFCRAEKLEQVIDLVDPDRKKEEISLIRNELSSLCGTSGAPYGEYAKCLDLLDSFSKREVVSQAEREGRRFVVHFVRVSYLMAGPAAQAALAPRRALPAMLLGCAGGVLVAACSVPPVSPFTFIF
ncbi:hypothetical protein HF086_013540 [Spodoptera exigua]|uniref:Alanyl-transfer RNA synthetases family profile domain-containing protein n=1 Tax=Spodoptera exigua TaxID=7107 RepID=A0A922SMQ2_SPOEX|nr:hypothetical protein HF086_013540 [Spodoptera exigua]